MNHLFPPKKPLPFRVFGQLRISFKWPNTLKLVLLSLSYLIINYSCLDQIDIDIPSGQSNALTIQAKLIYGTPSVFQLEIRRLFTFNIDNVRGINAEQVVLKNSQGQSIEITQTGIGLYSDILNPDDPNFLINFDNTYAIEVKLGDGEVYTSTLEPLIPVPRIDSVSFEKITVRPANPIDETDDSLVDVVAFSASTPLNIPETNDPSRLRWVIERTFKFTEFPVPGQQRKTCYITNPMGIYEPVLYDATILDLDYLEKIPLVRDLADFPFVEGYYSTIYQESLSEGAFTYFSQIEASITRQGDMFEAPAGGLFSNISNERDDKERVFGYFYVTQVDTIRQYVSPDFLMNFDTFCLRPFTTGVPDGCLDCLIELGSTIEPPSWWIE